MEDSIGRGDWQGNVVRQSSFRQDGSFKPTYSGKSTPKNSPPFRRLNTSRTPRRELRGSGGGVHWFRSSRLVYWLLLITLWAYLGFYVQSRWAHSEKKEGDFLGFGGKNKDKISNTETNKRRDLIANFSSLAVNNETNNKIKLGDSKRIDVNLSKNESGNSSKRKVTSKKRRRKTRRSLRNKVRSRHKAVEEVGSENAEVEEPDIPKSNTTYGLLVGPFGSTEDMILEWSPAKRSGTCDRKGAFAHLVWSRKFVLIFHELSMTGAPLSMMELATELLSCGATVSAVVLSKKGGLMTELSRRKIKVLEDKADLSFKTAMKADLVIAGSAVCASWIDNYIAHFPAGGSQIVWWLMENRNEYFDRAKPLLHRVKMLVFLSESQAKQWLTWCKEENIKLRYQPAVVPLSVNDELAFVSGMSCSLNSPSSTPEKMLEKRQLLRSSVRKEMGLTDNDMLVMSLSSINPGKGQLLLLEAAHQIVEQELHNDHKIKVPLNSGKNQSSLAAKYHLRAAKNHLRALLEKSNDGGKSLHEFPNSGEYFHGLNAGKKKVLRSSSPFTYVDDTDDLSLGGTQTRRKVLSSGEGQQEQALKILIGSVGSKSNKVPYVKEILGFLSPLSNLSKSVLWTPATTRVASLYSAADVYVINSQGLGETFGRVTIEAMAFGLPLNIHFMIALLIRS
ncbi:uncharacterized protein LOC120007519 isoform X2 [Tripterygium wilfordii]|uniref:uncharacterized protein LOC120007519 isoform X2 n=1 Tax=Tripterygium wilfordii TaxID=458696 RepID=UPI0018F7E5BA|nr:uncharacterized protein LOC120007519 isoform X2 [Tripterygium wilfordii]